jgi:hypothetical protein
MWKVAPPQFLRRFLIFLFPQKVASFVLKRVPGSSLGSIQFIFEVGIVKKLFYLSADEYAFSYLGLAYALKFFPLHNRILRLHRYFN